MIEPATGVTLRFDVAEIKLPDTWRKSDNFGIPFVRQGVDAKGNFGSLTMSELNVVGLGPASASLDTLAREQLRLLRDDPGIKRIDDAPMGETTMAYRLVGRSKFSTYDEYYGVRIGNFEYSLQFEFNTTQGTRAEAIATIQSILATWDFNP